MSQEHEQEFFKISNGHNGELPMGQELSKCFTWINFLILTTSL